MSPSELGVDATLILDTSHEAFVAMGIDGRIVAWNKAAQALFGWERSDVIGRELADTIVPERLREAHRRGLQHFLDTGEGPVLEARVELPALHRDGHEFMVEITISAVTAEGGRFFHAFLHDVSERVARERTAMSQLRVSEQLATATTEEDLALVVEAVCRAGGWSFGALWRAGDDAEQLHRPIVWHEPDRRLELFESASRAAGFHRGRGLPGIVWQTGQALWDWHEIAAEDRPRLAAAERIGLCCGFAVPLISGSEVVAVLELFANEAGGPDEEQRTLLAAAVPLMAEHIARRRAERDAAEQKDAFVSTVSHELRTPLTAIIGSAQTALLYRERLSADRLLEFLELIDNQARRLLRLVDDLLRMSALQSRAILPELTRVDLADAVREALDELDVAHLVIAELPDGIAAPADRDLFKQIVVNLVQNAMRYGDEPWRVVLEQDDAKGVVRFVASDAGPGVPPGFVPHLFEKFARAEQRSDRPGTGLGLSIVQDIARAMGGRVWHEHATPRGARFVVELPRS